MGKTLVCNFYGGPCTGKSGVAAGLFAELKKLHINCELVREYAKEATWKDDQFTRACQPYVTGKQYYRQCLTDGKVDVMVTDSPLLLGIIYGGRGATPSFYQWVAEAYDEFANLNIILERDPDAPFESEGRNQNKEECLAIDHEIAALLERMDLLVHRFSVKDPELLSKLTQLVQVALIFPPNQLGGPHYYDP